SGYGVCPVPSTPGYHQLTCVTWRPRGTHGGLLGTLGGTLGTLGTVGTPRLRAPQEAVLAPGDRHRLRTEGAGIVRLHLGVIARNFGSFGVHM
ncbi:B9D2 protein, partial [Malurus elegans]|nr:B9D2 protein [Malurus elegans]